MVALSYRVSPRVLLALSALSAFAFCCSGCSGNGPAGVDPATGGESDSGSGGSAENSSGGKPGVTGGAGGSSGGVSPGGATNTGGAEAGTGGASGEYSGTCRSFENGSGAANPCYVGADGKAHCINNDGTTVILSEVPGTAVNASGWDYTTRACVVNDAGTVYCGDYGALSEWLPSGASQVSGMADGYCALTSGDVLCQKKDGALETIQLGENAANLIGCFSFGCCAATVANEFYCWGNTQMALGTSTTDPVKVALPEGKSVVQIAAAQAHICALLDGGQVQCWGQGLERSTRGPWRRHRKRENS